jgi:hypothetical protein
MKRFFAGSLVVVVYGCSSTAWTPPEDATILAHKTITSLDVDVKGMVLVFGGEVSMSPDGLPTFVSRDQSRDVQVLCDPSTVELRREDCEFVDLGGVLGLNVNANDAAPRELHEAEPAKGLAKRQSGGWDRLLARTVVVGIAPGGGPALHMKDVLFNGATAPVADVTISSPIGEKRQ